MISFNIIHLQQIYLKNYFICRKISVFPIDNILSIRNNLWEIIRKDTKVSKDYFLSVIQLFCYSWGNFFLSSFRIYIKTHTHTEFTYCIQNTHTQ